MASNNLEFKRRQKEKLDDATLKKYVEMKRYMNVSDAEVAQMCGYKTVSSFTNASRKNQNIRMMVAIYTKMREAQRELS